jgi:hypothetical protein
MENGMNTDRKDQIREYKETPRPMGVYRVRNTATDRSLIGSSVDLPAMLNRQRFQLEAGCHPNRALQQDWKDIGPGGFEFEILDTMKLRDEPGYNPAEDLRLLVEMWMEQLSRKGQLSYNPVLR